jgi:hypothetical protein
MAFSVKQIKALLSENNMPVESLDKVAEEICARHSADLESIKEERDTLKKEAESFSHLKEQAEKYGGKNPYQVKYEALKEEFDKYKADTETKATKAKKESAYRKLLKDAGVTEKRLDAVLRVSDFDGIEFDSDGKIKDADKLTESIKKEWADFIPQTSQTGAPSQNPPSTTTGKTMTKDEIMKITDTAARQKAIADNHELFGI